MPRNRVRLNWAKLAYRGFRSIPIVPGGFVIPGPVLHCMRVSPAGGLERVRQYRGGRGRRGGRGEAKKSAASKLRHVPRFAANLLLRVLRLLRDLRDIALLTFSPTPVLACRPALKIIDSRIASASPVIASEATCLREAASAKAGAIPISSEMKIACPSQAGAPFCSSRFIDCG